MRPLVPPPVVAAALGFAMWLTHRWWPQTHVESPWLIPLALLLLAVGTILLCAAGYAFFRYKTTINPLAPERASTLITSGVYCVSRNPIYLADLLLMTAFAVWLGNLLNVVYLAMFIWIINRFQIAAEERALHIRFGERYAAYCAKVRRWL